MKVIIGTKIHNLESQKTEIHNEENRKTNSQNTESKFFVCLTDKTQNLKNCLQVLENGPPNYQKILQITLNVYVYLRFTLLHALPPYIKGIWYFGHFNFGILVCENMVLWIFGFGKISAVF